MQLTTLFFHRSIGFQFLDLALRFCKTFSRSNNIQSILFYFIFRSHMLQADSELQCQAWIQAIQAGVTKAYGSRPSMDLSASFMFFTAINGRIKMHFFRIEM